MNPTLTPAATYPTLGELQTGMDAIRAGRFRTTNRQTPTTPRTTAPSAWHPAEQVIPIIGASGSVGATTLAIALASVDARGTRVLECGPPAHSGLAAAATAELGLLGQWRRGLRDGHHGRFALERLSDEITYPDQVPPPNEPDPGTARTYLDCSWSPGQLLAGGWIGHQICNADTVVVVAVATLPGIRHLEATLTALAEAGGDAVQVVVRGSARHRWDRSITASFGLHTRTADRAGRLHVIPTDRHLAVHGLTTAPLPAAVLRTTEALAAHLPHPATTTVARDRLAIGESLVIDQAC